MGEVTHITSKQTEIILQICYKQSIYDYLYICNDAVTKVPLNYNCSPTILADNILSCGDYYLKHNKFKSVTLDAMLTHYLIRELKISPYYRFVFLTQVKLWLNSENKLRIHLVPANKEIIDYAWNYRTTNLIWERLELDHALSWLSTLGGAFSALGDYFAHCAVTAGKISFSQLKLAMRLGDPSVASRCRLFLSLSLIQRGYLKQAKHIILREFQDAKHSIVLDTRLIRMCQGIWAKLKYEIYRKNIRDISVNSKLCIN